MRPPSPLLLLAVVCLCSCALQLRSCAAEVYKPPAPLAANAFVGGNTSLFVYPEASNGSSSNYSMPSVTERHRFGIALSGGGMRAATLGLGYLRGLHEMGVTDGARYLTSNSGGSWLNAAFSFQQKYPIATFLGAYIPPQALNMSVVRTPGAAGSFELAISNAGLLAAGVVAAVKDVTSSRNDPGVGAWSTDVGRAFLELYDLNSDASTFTAADTSGPVHQALKSLDPAAVQVYTYKPYSPAGNNTPGDAAGNTANSTYRPFPIIMGSILLDTPLGFYPFEFTPLYVGIAPYYNDTTPPLGGGYYDPVAFNSPAPPPPSLPASVQAAFAATNVTGFDNGTILSASNATSMPPVGGGAAAGGLPGAASDAGNSSRGVTVTVTVTAQQPSLQTELLSLSVQPDYLAPLKVVVGISSSFITNGFQPSSDFGRTLAGTEVLRYWSPLNFTAAQIPFADGGSADNLAITPLLRRRVTKIVMFVAALTSVQEVNATDWAGYQYDVSGLFGAAPVNHRSYGKDGEISGVPVDLFNRKLQVFPQAAYQDLFEGLKKTTDAGGPTFHLANYTVLTNAHQAIFGGWQLEVLWVVNQRQAKWEASLPNETADTLASGRTSPGWLGRVKDAAAGLINQFAGTSIGDAGALGLQGYPFISTGRANYSPELTRLLSQQANWQVLQLQPQLQQLLRGTNITVKSPAQ